MRKPNKTSARSLCAVIMAAAMLLFSARVASVRAEDITAGAKSSVYKYAVTIEFGSMTFCYDYGTWDVNEMRYKADAANQNPANGTTAGYPGWYGFDGTSNHISVKYSNENPDDMATANRKLSVTLAYRALAASEGTVVDGVTMEFYSDATLTNLFSPSFTVPHTNPEDDTAKTVIYTSLRGEPRVSGGQYQSGTFIPIGMLTIRVGEITD